MLSFEEAGSPIGVSAAIDLAVSGSDLYYTVTTMAEVPPGANVASGAPHMHLVRLPNGARRPVLLATVAGSEAALLLMPTNAVVAVSLSGGATGQIVAIPLGRGLPTVLASANGTPSSTLATDGNNVYFADNDGLKRVPSSGGAAQILSNHSGTFALVGPSVIIADGSQGNVYSIPLDGGTPTTLASGQIGVDYPLSCGAGVCWTTHVNGPQIGSGTATMVQLLPGATPQPLVTSPVLYPPWRVLFNGVDFYLTTLTDATFGSLVRIPATGGPPVILSSQNGVAIDAYCIFSASGASGIYSVSISYDGGTAQP